MSRLLQDLKYSLRLLLKTPGFTLTAILVLALGIGANSAVFTITNELMLRPIEGPGAQGRVVGVYSHDTTRPDSYRGFSYPAFQDLRQRSDLFAHVAAFDMALVGLGEGESTRRTFAGIVSSEYFAVLGAKLQAGRTFTPEEERPDSQAAVAVVSQQYWKSRGSDPNLVGQTVRVNTRPFTIIGITPSGFTSTSSLIAPEVWLPIGARNLVANDFTAGDERGRPITDRRNTALMIYGRLKPGITLEAATAPLAAFSKQLQQQFPAENKNQLLTVAPLSRTSISTSPQTDGDMATTFLILMAMAGVVLLIASLNLANMMLARGSARRKEIAMRLALGAGRGQIIRQLLTEGFALSLVGGIFGLLIGYWGVSWLATSLVPVSPVPIAFRAAPDLRVLAATLGFCTLSTLIFGLGPAFKLSRASVVNELKEQAGEAPGGRRWFAGRNVLVGAQIALSLGLLTAAGLFVRGALKAGEADPGYRLDGQVLAAVDASLAGYDEVRTRATYKRLSDRLRALPGVQSVSPASVVAFGGFSEGRAVEKAGAQPGKDGRIVGKSAMFYAVGADYFKTLGLKVLRGREFSIAEEQDAGAPPVAIIDEPLAKTLFPGQDPLGQLVQMVESGEPVAGNGIVANTAPQAKVLYEVVGVAPGLRHDMFDKSPVAHIYLPLGSSFRNGISFHVRAASMKPGADAALLQAVRQEIRAVDERLPVLTLQTLTEFRDKSIFYWIVKVGANIFSVFGGVAFFLAVVGLYAVKAYMVARRTREIGIRMALGSTPGGVLALVLKEGLGLTLAGLAVGVLFSLGAGQAVGSMLYEVSRFDPLVFVSAPLLLGLASLAACYLPARRATRVPPMVALRTE